MAKYGPKAQALVKTEIKAMEAGTLRSGSGAKVTNPKQAIAIALSEARKAGAKMPPPPEGTATAARTGSERDANKALKVKKAARKAAAKASAKKAPAAKRVAAKTSAKKPATKKASTGKAAAKRATKK